MGPVPLHPSRGSAAGRARINRLRFALALIATGQLTLAETVAHRSNCVKIAVQATRAFIFMAPCSPRVPRRPRPRSAARTLASCTTKRRARRAPLPPARAPAAAAPRARAGAAQLWAERIRAGDPDFNLGKAVLKVDSRALQLARDAYDKEENVSHASASAAPLGVVFSSGPPRSRAQAQAARAQHAQAPEKARGAGGGGQQWRAAPSWGSGSWDGWAKGQKRERSWSAWDKKDGRKPKTPPRPVARR